jgi:hypothetical protein
MAEIAGRIRMEHTPTKPAADAPGLLHTESGVGGFWTVWRDHGGDGGQIDLEVLFNAVVSQPGICRDLFGSEGGAS